MACKLSQQARRERSRLRASRRPASCELNSFRRRREGDGGNFVRSLHDGVAALAMRGHTVTVQIILRQMHCENQDRDQAEI